ncbi:MAG: uroporphyrinogen-III synthase [Bacteroidetes bacterium]|nr:uroporphyrinogen-III synthase [Bacteroidota bacterium]
MKKILKDKKIVLTRTKEQSKESGKWLHSHGAKVIYFPCIKIVPIQDPSKLHELLLSATFDFVIFSSSNAVKIFVDLTKNSEHAGVLKKVKVIAVGSKTKFTCEQLGIKVGLVPENFSAKGILKLFSKFDLENKNILIPTSNIARKELREGLQKRKARIFPISVYDTVPTKIEKVSEELKEIKDSKPNLFIFTSPSTYNNFLKLADVKTPKSYFKGSDIAAIGSTTKEAIEMTGAKVSITPAKSTMNTLLDEIIRYYK